MREEVLTRAAALFSKAAFSEKYYFGSAGLWLAIQPESGGLKITAQVEL